MLNIAIVDDDQALCSLLGNYITQYFIGSKISIDDYSDGKEFIDCFNSSSSYDIIFLDIEMPELDGEKTGKLIRDRDSSESTYIIYVSSHTESLMPLFAIHPFDFVTKPFNFDSISRVLSKILLDMDKKKLRMQITTKRATYNIPVNMICFIESSGRKCIIHMAEGDNYEISEKLDSIFAKINEMSNSFFKIHKSFIINRSYVDSFDRNNVIIKEFTIPISRNYKDELLNNLFHTQL